MYSYSCPPLDNARVEAASTWRSMVYEWVLLISNAEANLTEGIRVVWGATRSLARL